MKPIPILVVFLASLSSASAAQCGLDTVAHYVASSGCSLGPLIYKGFFYGLTSFSGNPTLPPLASSSDITVQPTFVAGHPGVNISSSFFSVGLGQAVTYEIDYTIDPPPIIGGQSLEMGSSDSLQDFDFSGGGASVTQYYCVGQGFIVGLACADNSVPLSQQVYFGNTTSFLLSSITFPNTTLLAVKTIITLDGRDGPVSFPGFGSGTFDPLSEAPEPITLALTGTGILGLFLARRKLRATP